MYRTQLSTLRSHVELTAAIALLGLVWVLSGCAPASSAPVAQVEAEAEVAAEGARVYFSNVAEGDTITSPMTVTMAAENFVVAPAGEVHEGEGHLHILVDVPCVADGEVIVKDDAHLHYGQGQLEAGLTLTPGAHTLCLQAADGAHTALAGEGMRQQITVTVQ